MRLNVCTFDIETDNLPVSFGNKNQHLKSFNDVHILQLSYIIFTYDTNLHSCLNLVSDDILIDLVDYSNFKVNPVNKISLESLKYDGIKIADALLSFYNNLVSHNVRLLNAYNINFDLPVIINEAVNANLPNVADFLINLPKFDCFEYVVCNNIYNDNYFPNTQTQEAIFNLLFPNKNYTQSHSALDDVIHCNSIFKVYFPRWSNCICKCGNFSGLNLSFKSILDAYLSNSNLKKIPSTFLQRYVNDYINIPIENSNNNYCLDFNMFNSHFFSNYLRFFIFNLV